MYMQLEFLQLCSLKGKHDWKAKECRFVWSTVQQWNKCKSLFKTVFELSPN